MFKARLRQTLMAHSQGEGLPQNPQDPMEEIGAFGGPEKLFRILRNTWSIGLLRASIFSGPRTISYNCSMAPSYPALLL
jgi:hypothetical protein